MRCVTMLPLGILLFAAVAPKTPAAPAHAMRGFCELRSLVESGSIWGMEKNEFYERFKNYRFSWVDSSKISARFDDASRPVKFDGLPVKETRIRFSGGKVRQVSMVFEDESVPYATFRSRIRNYGNVPTTMPKMKREKDLQPVDGVGRKLWYNKQSAFLMEYSFDRKPFFESHFVRMKIRPIEDLKELKKPGIVTQPIRMVRNGALRKNVEKTKNAKLIKGVPNADQGASGYSAACAVQMILGYLGFDVDENDLLEFREESAPRAASMAALNKGCESVAKRFDVQHDAYSPFTLEKMISLIRDYNQAVKKEGVGLAPITHSPNKLDMEEIDEIYTLMAPHLLAQVRESNRNYKKFIEKVQRSVDAGVPLIWGVQLGRFYEEQLPPHYIQGTKIVDQVTGRVRNVDEPSFGGGHVRLIVGYREPEGDAPLKVSFVDPWGSQNVVKEMSVDKAWAITMAVHALRPKR